MSGIKAIIFDLNGVFIKGVPLSERLAKRSGHTVDQILSVMKPILKEVRNIARRGDEVWQPLLNLLGMGFKEFFEFYFSGESVDEQMIDFAKELKMRGFKLFLLSNNFRERTEFYRNNFPELFDVFSEAYFSWETGLVKPAKEAYQKLLEENDLKGGGCLYIDDSQENLDMAASFGIVGIKSEDNEQVISEVNRIIK